MGINSSFAKLLILFIFNFLNIRKLFMTNFMISIIKIKTAIRFSFTLFLFSISTYSQICNQWVKNYPGELSDGDMQFDSNSNIYLTGKNSTYIIKFNKYGVLKWAINKPSHTAIDLVVSKNNYIYVVSNNTLLSSYDTLGNSVFAPIIVSGAQPTSLCVDTSDNSYIVGKINSSVTFGTNTYTSGKFVVKYDKNGQLIWSLNYPTPSNSNSIILTDNINLFVTETDQTIFPGKLYVRKYNCYGIPSWNKLIHTSTSGAVNVFDGKFDSGNKILLSGEQSTGSNLLLRLDTSGAIIQNLGNNILLGGVGLHIKSENNNFYYYGRYPSSTNTNLQTEIAVGAITGGPQTKRINNILNLGSGGITAGNGAFLIGINNNNFYAAFFANNNDTSYVDIHNLKTQVNNITLMKFESGPSLYHNYNSTNIINCGDNFTLGKPLSSYHLLIQTNFQKYSFAWTPTVGLSSSTDPFPTISTPSTSTNYTVTMNPSCSDTIGIYVNNTTSFTYTTAAMTATFLTLSPNCFPNMQWDFGNGNTSNITPGPIVTYATPGTYTVCLKCNNQPNICAKCLALTLPSNGSGGIGITEINIQDNILIYPNPTSENLNISFERFDKPITLKLIDIHGKTILNLKLVNSFNSINVKGIISGLYFIKIYNDETLLKVSKINIL